MLLDSNTTNAAHCLEMLGICSHRDAGASAPRLVALTTSSRHFYALGTSYAKLVAQSRLRAAGMVPERFHDVEQFWRKDTPVIPCTTKCDPQLLCYAECAFQYTLLGESKGTIKKSNCSSTGNRIIRAKCQTTGTRPAENLKRMHVLQQRTNNTVHQYTVRKGAAVVCFNLLSQNLPTGDFASRLRPTA